MTKPQKLTPEAIKSLRAFAEDNADELFDEFLECGTWVRKDDLPEVEPEELAESGLIEDAERCEALSEGDEPTKEEIKLFHDNWVQTALAGDWDADDIPAYAISVVKDEKGNEGVALILRTGYSFSEINTWLEGIYSTTGEAIAHMEEDGWCS